MEKILSKDDASLNQISDDIEDYCLSKAMDEAKKTPLLTQEEALNYLEE